MFQIRTALAQEPMHRVAVNDRLTWPDANANGVRLLLCDCCAVPVNSNNKWTAEDDKRLLANGS